MQEHCFTSFQTVIAPSIIPTQLNSPFELATPEICKIAATELQTFITDNPKLVKYNFGLTAEEKGTGRGKMFGVLVVRNDKGALGFLCGFSGKLTDGDHHPRFVPSVFDVATDDFFIYRGMSQLKGITRQIKASTSEIEIKELKAARKAKSKVLQQQLFDNYNFLNLHGETKNLCTIFEELTDRRPAAAAGECAAPKLFQYAFEHHMKPLAIAEFWWGESPDSQQKHHGKFYPACHDKCLPILSYMLGENFTIA